MWNLSVLLPPILLMGGMVGLPIYFVVRYLRLREREVRALEGKKVATELGTLISKNAALQHRIEQLEAIVTSTDFELSRKILGAKRELTLNEMQRIDSDHDR